MDNFKSDENEFVSLKDVILSEYQAKLYTLKEPVARLKKAVNKNGTKEIKKFKNILQKYENALEEGDFPEMNRLLDEMLEEGKKLMSRRWLSWDLLIVVLLSVLAVGLVFL